MNAFSFIGRNFGLTQRAIASRTSSVVKGSFPAPQAAPGIPGGSAQPGEPNASQAARPPRRLYLRVPDRRGMPFRKARNLAEIFDGSFPLAFYDAETKQYFSAPGVMLSDYLLSELRTLLGPDNVILR